VPSLADVQAATDEVVKIVGSVALTNETFNAATHALTL